MRNNGNKKGNAKEFFIGSRLLVFTAHPDDEGIAAGTMYKNHQAGGKTTLICATYGEKGKSHLAKPVTDAALKKIRKNELLAAGKILKIDEIIFLGMPDAAVRANEKKLFKKSLPVIARVKPDYILSFGPDGMSGHWDHITVGKVALRIGRKLKIPVLAFTRSPEFSHLRAKAFIARRKFGSYIDGAPIHRKGNIKIKVDAAIKRRAWSNHKSQFGAPSAGGPLAGLSKTAAAKIFGYEHFVREAID
jgi:LmbE family N-acetylglucosaminyl deacetylase